MVNAKYGERQTIKPPQEVEPEPEVETTALATVPEEPDYLAGMMNDLDNMIDSINVLAATTDEVIESVEEAQDEDGANELSDDDLRTAVLNGTVPTGIADGRSSASCEN